MNNPNINSDSFDQDLPMFAAMRPAMFTQKLGMQHALAEQFSSQANDAIACACKSCVLFILFILFCPKRGGQLKCPPSG
jgi:hypothetical protein